MDYDIRPISPHDIFLWPDGTWRYRDEVHPLLGKSDDYEVIPEGTPRHNTFDEVMA